MPFDASMRRCQLPIRRPEDPRQGGVRGLPRSLLVFPRSDFRSSDFPGVLWLGQHLCSCCGGAAALSIFFCFLLGLQGLRWCRRLLFMFSSSSNSALFFLDTCDCARKQESGSVSFGALWWLGITYLFLCSCAGGRRDLVF